jgi:hypothetical protein
MTNATPDDLLEWATARNLSCSSDSTDFVNHRVMIGGMVSVEFRAARPHVVVEWGEDCWADFPRGAEARALIYFLAGLLPDGIRSATVTFDLSDPDALHVLTTALQDYAEKERDMAANEGGHESRERWAAIADRMRAQAEAAG